MTFCQVKRWWLSTCIAVLVAACGGSGEDAPASGGPGGGGGNAPPPAGVQSVEVTPGTATLEPGKTKQFNAVARDAFGNAVAGAVFTWSTSDVAVATIDGNGLATGVAAGTVGVNARTAGVLSNGVTLAVVAPPAGAASSETLIDAALAAGEIDAETALVYRVFARFSPAKLPDRYRGVRVESFESSVLHDAIDAFDTLSPAAQGQLMPFLRRPASVGSWLDPSPPAAATRVSTRTVRGSKPAGNTGAGAVTAQRSRPDCFGTMGHWAPIDGWLLPFRVWYDTRQPAHANVAQFVGIEIENKVWPKLVGQLNFLAPMDDGNGGNCDGGNGKLDIYIVDPGYIDDLGLTVPEAEPSYSFNREAAYILLRANLQGASQTQAIAHEFAHVVHRAYPKAAPHKSYGWFVDAFANWAALQVYSTPPNTAIANQAGCLFDTPETPLDENPVMTCRNVRDALARSYGAYLPLEVISWKHPDSIRRIVENTSITTTAFQAMENVLTPDGFKAIWPVYAQTLWNQAPIDKRADSFVDRELSSEKPKLARDRSSPVNADLGDAFADETPLDARVNNMSVKFYHFKFSDEKTRSLMFHNTWNDNFRRGQKVSVYALYKPAGQDWKEEDWSEYEWIGFCRDYKDQRLEELVVIVASAEWRGTNPVVQAAGQPKLMRNNIGCYGYTGYARHTYVDNQWTSGSINTTFVATFDLQLSALPPQFTDLATNRKRVPIAAPLFRGGTLDYDDRHADSSCSYQARAQISEGTIVLGGKSAGVLMINNFLDAMPVAVRNEQIQVTGNTERAYVATGVSTTEVRGSVTGTNCVSPYDSSVGAWWLTTKTLGQRHQVLQDGRLKGTLTGNGPGDSFREEYEWEFTPMREP